MIIYARDTYLLSLKCIGCDIARSSNHRESNDTKDVLFRMNGHSGSATSHRHTGPLRLGTLSISTTAKRRCPACNIRGAGFFEWLFGSVRLHEKPNDAGRTLGMGSPALRHDLGRYLFLGQARRQLFRLEISRNQHESVMMRLHSGRRARSGKETHSLSALTADVFIGSLADFAFGKPGHVRRN